METAGSSHDAKVGLGYPRARKWIWTPRYAKFWWSAIPCWWLGMAGSVYFDSLAQFYSSALAGVMNVFFFPPVVFMMLGIGFFREWVSSLLNDEEVNWSPAPHPDFIDDSCGRDNPMDPRSGPLWVGNNLDPHSPNYVGPR